MYEGYSLNEPVILHYNSRMRIIFLVPGLFRFAETGETRTPCLNRLLTRSSRSPGSRLNARDLLINAIIPEKDTNRSAAWYSCYADFGQAPFGDCYYCAPVHLRVDMADAILFDRRHFTLSMEETHVLLPELNGIAREYNSRIEIAPGGGHWYLMSDAELNWTTPILQDWVTKPIGSVLTDSRYSSEWRCLMNELQILLHQHPVNADRERRGDLPVNGIWIHSGSRLGPTGFNVSIMVTDSMPTAHIVLHESVVHIPDLRAAIDEKSIGDVLVFDESLMDADDLNHWRSRIEWMEQAWFMPATAWLKNKMIDEIIIEPVGRHRFIINRQAMRRFWRRSQPLANYYTE